MNQWWNVWFCWLCCQHLWSRCSNKLKNTSALWRPPLPKNRWWWWKSSSSSSWIWRVVMMGVPGWARIPLLPVKQEVCLLPVSCFFENQNPTRTAHSFKNNPTDSFHISNGEKQQKNCCFLLSFFYIINIYIFQIGLHTCSYTTMNQGTTDLINSYILSILHIYAQYTYWLLYFE